MKSLKRPFDCRTIVAKAAQYTYKTNLDFCQKKVNFSQKLELMDFEE